MKTNLINYYKTSSFIIGITTLAFLSFSCNPSAKNETAEEETVVVEEVDVMVEEEYWIIDEHKINDVPITSKAKTEETESTEETEITEAGTDYEIYSVAMVEEEIIEEEYEPLDEVLVTEMLIPLDETQTLTSYSKKGKAQDTLQVISSGDGEIEQIIFTHKKHKDVYDVSAGMSGKEVKKLRKELKHMVKHGKVFLYDDVSNIMCLMDAQDAYGNEITEADIETMEVQAIIWKDKKHHKKN